MKILQVNNYHYLKGGSERVYLETTQLLEKYGHEVLHFSVNDEKSLESPTKSYFIQPFELRPNSLKNAIKLVLKFIYNRESAKKMNSLIEKEKPEIVHLHIFYGRLSSSILPVLKKHRIPVVMSVHEYRMICPAYVCLKRGRICTECGGQKYYKCFLGRCIKDSFFNSFFVALECYIRDLFFSYQKHVNKFIMVSEFIDHLHKELNVIKSNSSVIKNFCEASDCVQNSKGYFIYVGRLSKEKGVLSLLEAWKKISDAKLVVVGDGPQKVFCEKYCIENNIQNIEFIGHLDKSEVFELLKYAESLICPSQWFENNPLSIIEAMCQGIPVIGTNIGGIPELVINDKTGFLVAPGDSEGIEQIVKRLTKMSLADRMKLRQQTLNYAKKHFSSQAHYEKLLAVYLECKKKSGSG